MNWNIEHVLSSPVCEPLRVHGGAALDRARPDPDDLQRLVERREPPVRVASGRPLRLVPQGRKPLAFEERYEVRLYRNGELQVRRDNWHDYFNVLVWLAFPRAKAALNARHYSALEAQRAAGAANRGPVQDALTLFDEGGVVMVSCDDDLLEMTRDFRWKDLFWRNRGRLRERTRFFLFGHALYEKMQRPFPGITGRCILLPATPAFLAATDRNQLDRVDERVAAILSDPASLAGTRDLAVLPVLGVPGWHDGGESEGFYDDAEYFRPGRRVRETGIGNRET